MKSIVVFLFVFFTSNAFSFTCIGKVETVDVQPNGHIAASITGVGGSNKICSVSGQRYDFTPEACKAIYSSLLSAFASSKNVKLYFSDGSNDNNCNMGNWNDLSSLGLYYLRLEH